MNWSSQFSNYFEQRQDSHKFAMSTKSTSLGTSTRSVLDTYLWLALSRLLLVMDF